MILGEARDVTEGASTHALSAAEAQLDLLAQSTSAHSSALLALLMCKAANLTCYHVLCV